MCRLFAVHAKTPIRALANAAPVLTALSAKHRDGWGLARFAANDTWSVERSIRPAHQSQRFAQLSGDNSQHKVLLAHLRLASVGSVDTRNNHPFTSNGWAFMHNGTLLNFERARFKLEAEIAPQFRDQLRGATDSERCFALFLTFLQGRSDVEISEAARALSRVISLAASLCDEPGALSKMNFLTSNGHITLATRRGHTLVMNEGLQALSIASQPVFRGQWHDVPEGGLIAVDDTLNRHNSSVVDWK